jgi:hypothetical protein
VTDVRQDVAFALAPSRSPEEQIALLRALQDYLQDDEAILALAEAARIEGTTSVRAAIVDVLLRCDPTRLFSHDEVLQTIMSLSALEPEPELRLAATRSLAFLAPSRPAVQDLLAQNLVYDLDHDVQHACLVGLAACPRKERSVVECLLSYARLAPAEVREDLLGVYEQLDLKDFETALMALLDPLAEDGWRRRVLDRLDQLASPSATASARLAEYFALEPLPELRHQIVRVLSRGAQMSPDVLQAVLDDVSETPEDATLLDAFWGRASSWPDAPAQLEALFRGTGSTHVKLCLLELLAESGAVPLFTAALEDPSPWVRAEAVRLCSRHGRPESETIAQALVVRIPREPYPQLRGEMIDAFRGLGSLSPLSEQFVVSWLAREGAPDGRKALAEVLLEVAINDENRAEILRTYVEVLKDPLFDAGLKDRIAHRLRAFEYRDAPGLDDCLIALMERTTDLLEVQELYEHLRTLQVGAGRLIPLLRKLFYRFVGSYPQEPLTTWLSELANAAPAQPDLQAEIPYLVRLTGAWWVLEKAEVAEQKNTMLALVLAAARKGPSFEAGRVLAQAHQSRTLRKSDAVRLFGQLLYFHDSYPLLDDLVRIFREERIISADLVEWCLSLLRWFPDASFTFSVKEYLRDVGPAEPTWGPTIDAAFSPREYQHFQRTYAAGDDSYIDPGWTEYQWQVPGELEAWPIADLFLNGATPELIATKLSIPPVEDPSGLRHSFHYLVLAHLDRRPALDATLLGAVGRLARSTRSSPGGLVHDRALYVFNRKWPDFVRSSRDGPLEAELAQLAEELSAELRGRQGRGGGPETGLDDGGELLGDGVE